MSEEKVALILGAGATLADGLSKPLRKQPPLDQGFFANSLRSHASELKEVLDYMQQHYGTNVRESGSDSLERVMAVLYTDVFGGDLEEEAFSALRTLMSVFLRRLATTTGDIEMTKSRLLYRLVVGFLRDGFAPVNVTIITFNQDIQAEKALDAVQRTTTRSRQIVFKFPHCYRLPGQIRLTSPTRGGLPTFDVSESEGAGVTLLKLHGSLNWYSTHNTPNPKRGRLFDPARAIGITTRKSIDTSMKLDVTGAGRKKFTFPIVVPPVVHKSGILHNSLKPVWALAEERLQTAQRVIIFGYSCPNNDWEAANLVCRSLRANRTLKELSVIDPDPSVVLRYVQLGAPNRIGYYRSAAAYLTSE